MNDLKQILDYLTEEDKHLKGMEAISLLYRIKGFVKSQMDAVNNGMEKEYNISGEGV